MEVKRSSKAIQITLPFMTISCSLRGTNIEALHNPTVKTSIMLEFLAKNLWGNKPLVPNNKLFKSPSRFLFERCGIARAMPIEINKTKVCLDLHIYAILEFDILIGHPLENLIQEKPSHGGPDKKLGTTASATPIPCPESPKVNQQPNHNPFEDVKFICPFVSPKHAYETDRASSPSLEPKPCPSGYPNTILEKENLCAMDISELTLETKRRDSTYEHENFTFKTPQVSYSLLKSPELILLSTPCPYEEHNHPSLLVSKLFRRMVVDAFIITNFTNLIVALWH